ncbi:MAG: VWA-like domain-containing protein, partial [Lachnospiraceae bacterium]|nr:VWA-like domain-containing protein [Lachnospiraceae bacterium]
MIQEPNKDKKIQALAEEVMKLAHDSVTMRFRFFDTALSRIRYEWVTGLCGAGFTSKLDTLQIDPVWFLQEYMEAESLPLRLLLHGMLHLIFLHPFQYDKLLSREWDLACDIAVENIILTLLSDTSVLSSDSDKKMALDRLSRSVPSLTADALYREFTANRLSDHTCKELQKLFSLDLHDGWHLLQEKKQPKELTVSEEDWKRITRRIRADLKSFSQNKSGSESFEKNMDIALKERYNYREILKNFMVAGEEIGLNDEEFDYVYYTYGLSAYGNMPLVEPLEYKENKKIREFVIAIDTSASCRGETVKQFIRKTYQILKDSETFFQKINVHIIQCDAQVRSDITLSSQEDFDTFIEKGEIRGFGSTDFRPVFDYVEELTRQGVFENLAGLIYFTDG